MWCMYFLIDPYIECIYIWSWLDMVGDCRVGCMVCGDRWVFLFRRSKNPHTIQPTRQSSIMSNHDPIYTQCKDQFNNTCTTSFIQTPYEWQAALGSTILAAHTPKTSICQLLVRPTGGGKTLVSTATSACIKVITLCIYPLRPIKF